jgi:DNA-binding CsgD family transcriptional regulator
VSRAAAWTEESLTLARRIGAAFLLALGLPVLAEIRLAEGHTDEAMAMCGEALLLSREFGPATAANALTGFAGVAARQDQRIEAARLLGAVQAVCDRLGWRHAPAYGLHQRVLAAVRGQVDEPTFAAAWEAGRTLSLSEATSEASVMAAQREFRTAHPSPATAEDTTGLTPREREILRLVVAGKSNPEIGTQLFISHRTVATHLRNVYDKLRVAGRAEAISAAIRRNLT